MHSETIAKRLFLFEFYCNMILPIINRKIPTPEKLKKREENGT
jgi:hypothetical protein